MRKAFRFCIVPLTFLIASFDTALAGNSCGQLTKLNLTKATVVSAEDTAAGQFLPPGIQADTPEAATYKKLPRFCRVVVKATPSADSGIAIEVWLPVTNWNRKLRGQGNGGFAGSLDYRGLAHSVGLGYASVATDAGHKGEATDSSWALGHPEKIIDFGYRAVHEMTGVAKTVVETYYGQAEKRAYFDACSDGGREALMEAQRFPEDYDGILAGAPANDWTEMLAGGLQVEKSVLANRANFIPPDKLPMITSAVLKSCNANDDFLNNPPECHFDPGILLCAQTRTGSCLSAAQVQTLKSIYRGGLDSSGRQIFPGLMPSSEAGDGGWQDWVTGKEFGKSDGIAYTRGFFQNMVYEDPNWDLRAANVDSALQRSQEKLAPILNATDPDLGRFKARGGKLILYHGWIDPAISPLNTVRYYNEVASKMGGQATEQFVRLYMVPGMQHCAGGPGPFIFGQLGIGKAHDSAHNAAVALERWVENSQAPREIIATKLRDDSDSSKGILMTRPLCPYPQIAQYAGSGDLSSAGSYKCSNP